MYEKADWIIENIRTLLREKGVKVENISREIGISQGEFSKIMSGQRKDYYKYLPRIATSLDVSFHRLVIHPGTAQNNPGEISSQGLGQVNMLYNNFDKKIEEHHRELIQNLKDEIIFLRKILEERI